MSEPIPALRYGPTSGVMSGVFGLVLCAGAAVAALRGGIDAGSLRIAFAALAGGVLVWAYMLRPRIVLEEGGRTVLIRNPFVDHRVPLAAVTVVGVRTVTTIKTDDARYDGVAVGHSVRKLVRGNLPKSGGMSPFFGGRMPRMPEPDLPSRTPRVTEMPAQDAMTEQILFAADRARTLGFPTEPAERHLALPELVALAVFVVGFAVSFAF